MYGVSKINIETDLMMISVQDVAFRGNSLSRYLDIFAETGVVVDMIRQSGHTPGVAFVRAADDKADSKVAAQLGIPTGTPILRISRLCTADGRPAIFCEDVVEKAKLQRPYTAEELRQPIFDFLQNVCGISSYLDLTDLRPVAADAALADVFQVPQGTPLLNMDEVDYDIEGAPVFASNEYFADGIFHHTVLRKKL